jgi:glutamate dehydrogenase
MTTSAGPAPEAVTDDPSRHDDVALDPVLARLAELVAPEQAACAVAFARAAYRRLPPEQVRALDVGAAARQLASAFAFVDARPPGELALRVYNPTVDEHGWSWQGTAVEVNVEDGPFLLSTMTEELSRLGVEVARSVHPILGIERDDHGHVARIVPARGAAERESWMLLELEALLDEGARDEVTAALRGVLGDARATARDFPAMREQVEEIAFATRASAGAAYPRDEVDEVIALLRWLLDDHFIFLGYREYDLVDVEGRRAGVVARGSGLGILSDDSVSSWADPVLLDDVEPGLRRRMEGGDLLVVSRTNRRSTVHRHVRMLYIGVKKVAGDGTICGEYRVLGLFAQQAFAEPASVIPVVRRKLRQVLEREDVVDHSYDERVLRTLFEAFPKGELFQIDVDALRRVLVALLGVTRRQEVRLLAWEGSAPQSTSAVVALPRDRFTDDLRRSVVALLLDRFDAAAVDEHIAFTERGEALLHFAFHAAAGKRLRELDVEALEHEVEALTRTWSDALAAALEAECGREDGQRLAVAWKRTFPPGYTETTSPADAVADVVELAQLGGNGDVRMAVRAGAGGLHRFKLYKAGAVVELSAFLPILESLGLVVVEEIPHRLEGVDVAIHDFGVRVGDVDAGVGFDPERDGARAAAAALATWRGDAEADSLNRLVLHARLTWEDAVVLRAYRRYRRQIGTSFTEAYQNDALVGYPDVARALIALFAARFDPERADSDAEAARQAVLDACEAVQRLDQDRILRGFLGLVDATLRTNRYRPGRGALAFKLDSSAVPDVPKPVPHVEVFVYSPAMEAVHLRGGPVARGGIRWSDRQEDFRTEILGLMKAQMVKNAVIVPSGSKGGFVLKGVARGEDDVRERVLSAYETFMRGLLDLTDNVVDGEVVPPPGVRRPDGDDPYLVVAADRGTATFSDVANKISAEYRFWLGDAFASGGSRGYDHKAMGITARGAWVAVQRHFRELDIDVQAEPVTVVGIGDMSGDVFGNGMLRSNALKLVAAFDHRDIFLDPDPDPALSFAERERLYHLPRSSWQDYDRAVISAGGGVWSRTAKRIPLSEQARGLLRVEADALSPPELIRALLAAPVDLLFAGGIGTFVKAATETDADVGDRANDAIRVDADEVGARVVGEGGNLAFTQRGRIQYARRGGRINTDAIDNSAGVDTSDHEVNLKILLGAVVDRGELALDERDALLAAVADDVAVAVLRDVELQTGAISQEIAQAPGGLEPYEALMRHLEESVRLDREVEALPATAEIARRREAGAFLTRPELAVLLGYAKVDLAAHLLASGVPDQPAFTDALAAYFPRATVETYPDVIAQHRLRRELIATVVANDVVNRLGITWHLRTARELGASLAEVAAAYWVARAVAGADADWRAIERLGDLATPPLELELKGQVDRLVDAFARAYLRQGAASDVAGTIARDRPAFAHLAQRIIDLASPRVRAAARAQVDHFVDLGLGSDLAERVVTLGQLAFVPDVAAVARDSGEDVVRVAQVFVRLSELLPLEPLHQRLARVKPSGQWERWQHRGLVDELRELRRTAAERALKAYRERPGGEPADVLLDQRSAALERVQRVLRLLEREPDAGLPAVAVAVRLLHHVVAG